MKSQLKKKGTLLYIALLQALQRCTEISVVL